MIPNGPAGTRVIYSMTGKVYGPYLTGTIVAPSSVWITFGQPDGSLFGINVQMVIQTDTGELVYKHIIGRSKRDPEDSEIRSAVTFEASTTSVQYSVLNNKMVFGHGTKTGNKIKMNYCDTS